MSTSDILLSSSTPEEQGKNIEIIQDTDGNGEHAVASGAGHESLKTIHDASERNENQESRQVADLTEHAKAEQQSTEQVSSGMMEAPSNMHSSDTSNPREDSLPEQIEGLSLSPKKPGPLRIDSSVKMPPPPPPKKDDTYLDPTPKTPLGSQSPARSVSDYSEKELPDVPRNGEPDEKGVAREGGKGEDSQSEIQSIMEQFADDTRSHGKEEIMSPRLELAEQFLGGPTQFPPRHSSLEPLKTGDNAPRAGQQAGPQRFVPPVVPPKSSPLKAPVNEGPMTPMTPRSPNSVTGPPPPEPEPDQPFDFHRFLEQLRHRTADPVAKFLRSFLTEFGKKQWMVHEQVKIISDFLEFITNKMAQCEVWRNVSDTEFDNAKEGMEKLVMNRLYSQTFSPAIPPPPTPARSRSKRREMERMQGPWRRGQHQEDVERDEILAQKIRIYSWVREEHLDIPPVGPHGRRFLNLAQQGEEAC